MALKILEKLEKRLKPSVYTNLHSNLTRLLNHELTTVRYSKSTTYTTNQLYTIDIRLRISIEKSVSTHIYLHLNKDNNCMEVQLVVGFHIPLPLSVPELMVEYVEVLQQSIVFFMPCQSSILEDGDFL